VLQSIPTCLPTGKLLDVRCGVAGDDFDEVLARMREGLDPHRTGNPIDWTSHAVFEIPRKKAAHGIVPLLAEPEKLNGIVVQDFLFGFIF
jgi:hypothetical protein